LQVTQFFFITELAKIAPHVTTIHFPGSVFTQLITWPHIHDLHFFRKKPCIHIATFLCDFVLSHLIQYSEIK